MNLGLKFSPAEEQTIKRTYDLKGNGRVSWKQFANSIESSFTANNLNVDPSFQKVEPSEL